MLAVRRHGGVTGRRVAQKASDGASGRGAVIGVGADVDPRLFAGEVADLDVGVDLR